MYAIVNIAGQQYKVEKDQKLFVHRLAEKEGESVNFDEVLLIDNEESVVVGDPTIKGAMISGKVISHPKGDKIKVFKKKRRKGYQVKTGHRQYLTEIQIEDIIEKGAAKESKSTTAKGKAQAADPPAPEKPASTKPAAVKEEKPVSATEKPAAEKPAAKKAAKPAAKKTTTAKTTSSKPAASKPAAKKQEAKKPATQKPATKKPGAGEETKE